MKCIIVDIGGDISYRIRCLGVSSSIFTVGLLWIRVSLEMIYLVLPIMIVVFSFKNSRTILGMTTMVSSVLKRYHYSRKVGLKQDTVFSYILMCIYLKGP